MVDDDAPQVLIFLVLVVDVPHKKYHLLLRYLARAMELCLLVPAIVVEILGLIRSGTKVAKAERDPIVVDQTFLF